MFVMIVTHAILCPLSTELRWCHLCHVAYHWKIQGNCAGQHNVNVECPQM